MKKLIGAAIAATAIALSPTAPAHADSNDYFSILAYNGMVTWDYPLVLNQGYAICDMLWNNVNPYFWLLGNGYDSTEASIIISSAQQGLCPGNAVTAPPPQLQYAV